MLAQQFGRGLLVLKLLAMKANFGKEFSPNDTDTNFPGMTNQMKAPLEKLSHGAVCLIFIYRIKFQVCS